MQVQRNKCNLAHCLCWLPKTL